MITPTSDAWRVAATFLIGYTLVASGAYLLAAGLVAIVRRLMAKPKRYNPGMTQLFK